ncbi:molybdopterin biosynthesis protein [Elioraea tepidiphila]|jgi:putative molybdopterin biosynthesis protein|uniref:molybdopterin biosynthesis protein n=1 Tax=Elioraea tepidiphila TaxID=457934 RepID=UPI002FD93151
MPPLDAMAAVRAAARQEQFLEVVSEEEARRRFAAAFTPHPLGAETVPLGLALGRVLAEDVIAGVDVPGFDRSIVDGFAVRAADTLGASELAPVRLRLNPEVLACGHPPALTVEPGTASVIATGGMMPRGADAVVMVEHAEPGEDGTGAWIALRRPVAAGAHVGGAGGDIARGETVLRRLRVLTSRELGMLAAVGRAEVPVLRRPRVAVLSTGDELIPPGAPARPAGVFDSNGAIVAAAVVEAGGEAIPLGIVPDDEAALGRALTEALASADLVVLSGGTSKGAGDLCYRVVSRLGRIVVHGVALKPGKPLCLAVAGGKPLIVLPGFPTSAVFTFHGFVAPLIRAMAGLAETEAETVQARLAVRLPSELGRTEYAMVSLVQSDTGLAAYPLAKGSGAVTAFSLADGFVAVPALAEAVEAGAPVTVTLIGRGIRPADLVVIGSHCVGLDRIAGLLAERGVSAKVLNVGSLGGLAAARRGETDLAPMHLLDPKTGIYNRPLLPAGVALIPGWRRMQGIVFRPGDPRFEGRTPEEAVAAALADPACLMVNRNAGSGTRVLIDALLKGARPPGFLNQPKSHNAVAAAVAQGRADWGVAIATVARDYGLGFLPLAEEHYDFAVPEARLDRAPVREFRDLLTEPATRAALTALGFSPSS